MTRVCVQCGIGNLGYLDRARWRSVPGKNRDDYCRECWREMVEALILGNTPRYFDKPVRGIRYGNRRKRVKVRMGRNPAAARDI